MGDSRACFRFYAELNDFLAAERREVAFEHPIEPGASVKHAIEALGVPHTEVDLILVNGESTDFTRRLEHGDRVSVYPVFESLDIGAVLRVRPQPLRELRFVLDAHLGRLAAYLRMLGFDALYENGYEDRQLAEISHREQRVLLTRDRDLLKRSLVTRGYLVRETEVRPQLLEVLRRFDLFTALAPFRRCLRCNRLLEPVAKEAVADRLEPATRALYEEFQMCRTCNRVYWKGSHYRRMERFIEWVKQAGGGNENA